MLPHKGGEHLHDRTVVFPGVAGDPLEAVNPTQSNVELFAAELIDRPGEALR